MNTSYLPWFSLLVLSTSSMSAQARPRSCRGIPLYTRFTIWQQRAEGTINTPGLESWSCSEWVTGKFNHLLNAYDTVHGRKERFWVWKHSLSRFVSFSLLLTCEASRGLELLQVSADFGGSTLQEENWPDQGSLNDLLAPSWAINKQ